MLITAILFESVTAQGVKYFPAELTRYVDANQLTLSKASNSIAIGDCTVVSKEMLEAVLPSVFESPNLSAH